MLTGVSNKLARLSWPGRLFWFLVLLLPICVAATTSPGKRVVDEAVDASDADTMRLELRFEMPVSYLWHFPHAPKDEFLIAIQPIQVLSDYDRATHERDNPSSPREGLDFREHIRIPPTMANIITDLYYDGTEFDEIGDNSQVKPGAAYTPKTAFIVLKTNRNVGINVKQGVGGRKLIIEFSSIAPQPASECGNGTKPDKKKKATK